MSSKEQQIRNTHDSTINQAGGNITITNGVSVADVMSIVSNVVADKLTIYQQKAETVAEIRLQEFKQGLVKCLQDIANEKLSKFNQPAIQIATRRATLGYIQSGDSRDKENLLDLLIERVNVEEHSTKQHIVDMAIQVLPTLSPTCLNLLAFVGYTNLMRRCRNENYRKWVECVNPIIDALGKVSSLDIDFLNQSDCTFSTLGFRQDSFLERQKKACDLLFRHEPSKDVVKHILDRHGLLTTDTGYHFLQPKSEQWVANFFDLFLLRDGYSIQVQMNNLEYAKELFVTHGYSDLAEDLQIYYEGSQPFSDKEVEDYYININPNWRNAFQLLERDDIASLRLKPVGVYIACRILKKLSNSDLSLDIFYQD